MSTRPIMISSALIMGLCGILASFLPHKILHYLGVSSDGFTSAIVQIIGALYFGFAMMNWMAQSVLIGGIYARPLVMGNFTHFVVGALALMKGAFASSMFSTTWIIAAVYGIFAVLFGFVLFRHPSKS